MDRKALRLLLPLLVLLFYIVTLAPSVLWGDDAMFQRLALTNQLQQDGSGHWMWFRLARLFLHLPFEDPAFKTNLLSAVAATATVVIIYYVAKALSLSNMAALVATGSLTVSHTFWTHAVRTEVYTVFTLLLALELLCFFHWTKQRFWPLLAAVGLFGLTLLGHQMALLLLPAGAVALWLKREQLTARKLGFVIAAFLLGLAPALLIIQNQIGAASWSESFILYFTYSGREFQSAMFDYSLASFPRDFVLWIGFLGLQFPSPAFLLGAFALVFGRDKLREPAWIIILILYLTDVAFAFSYRVNDFYVFYLPSFLAFALIVGLGWDTATEKLTGLKQKRLQQFVIALVLIGPPIVYFGLSTALRTLDLNPLQIRTLPGREPNSFFLWPSKQGHTGSAEFGRTALSSLPPNSLLIADHTPYETLQFIQTAENMRPDVQIRKVEAYTDLQALIDEHPTASAVFFADNNETYYDFASLGDHELVPFYIIYQLEER